MKGEVMNLCTHPYIVMMGKTQFCGCATLAQAEAYCLALREKGCESTIRVRTEVEVPIRACTTLESVVK